MDHDLGGVNDPFLQIALLRVIQAIVQRSGAIETEFARRQLADVLEAIVSTSLRKGESVPARVSV